MKVIGFFLFLILLVVKSKAKYVEGHIKTYEVILVLSKKDTIINSLHNPGLGFRIKILFLIGTRTL